MPRPRTRPGLVVCALLALSWLIERPHCFAGEHDDAHAPPLAPALWPNAASCSDSPFALEVHFNGLILFTKKTIDGVTRLYALLPRANREVKVDPYRDTHFENPEKKHELHHPFVRLTAKYLPTFSPSILPNIRVLLSLGNDSPNDPDSASIHKAGYEISFIPALGDSFCPPLNTDALNALPTLSAVTGSLQTVPDHYLIGAADTRLAARVVMDSGVLKAGPPIVVNDDHNQWYRAKWQQINGKFYAKFDKDTDKLSVVPVRNVQMTLRFSRLPVVLRVRSLTADREWYYDLATEPAGRLISVTIANSPADDILNLPYSAEPDLIMDHFNFFHQLSTTWDRIPFHFPLLSSDEAHGNPFCDVYATP